MEQEQHLRRAIKSIKSIPLAIWKFLSKTRRAGNTFGRAAERIFNFFPGAIFFFAGLACSILMKIWPTMTTELTTDQGLAVVLLGLIVFLALALASLLHLRLQIAGEIDRSRLSVKFYFKTSDEDSDQQIYEPIIGRIRTARKSVRIFGSFRKHDSISTPSRRRYFDEIESIIKKKIASGDAFIYERLVQVNSMKDPKEVRGRSYDDVTTLQSDEVDPLTYGHCHRVMDLAAKQAARVQIFLRQLDTVMPMITLVLIDEEYLVLCLPWLERKGMTLDTQQLGKGIIFHDLGTSFCTEMIAMFNVLAHNAAPILKVGGPTGRNHEHSSAE